jgi:hypothetical protein
MAGSAVAQSSLEEQLHVFGLRFGETLEQAEANGMQRHSDMFKKPEQLGPFSCHQVSSLPLQPSTTDWAVACFSEKVGLQKILWGSEHIFAEGKTVQDRLAKLRQSYNSLKKTLERKYGAAHQESEPLQMTYCDADLRMYLQKHVDEGFCRTWSAKWRGSYGFVELALVIEIVGTDYRSGFNRLTYEGPKWISAFAAHEDDLKSKDNDAF